MFLQVSSIEKRCVEKDQQLRDINEELKMTKVSLSNKEGRVSPLRVVLYCGVCACKYSGAKEFAGPDPGERALE